LQTCASVLDSMLLCKSLTMLEPFHGFHFGHALSKVCQYVITNVKMVHGLSYTSIKAMQINIQNVLHNISFVKIIIIKPKNQNWYSKLNVPFFGTIILYVL